MGATFRNSSGKRQTWRKDSELIFGINYATRFHTLAPKSANFHRPNDDNIQLAIATYDGEDVLFQFRLSRQNNLQIQAYDPNAQISGKVIVNSDNPSIDAIINNSMASPSIKYEATKVKDIIDKTYNGIQATSIRSLIDYLKRRKRL